MTVIHHDEIRRRLRPRYDPSEIAELIEFLRSRGTLTLTPLPTGLYPAAAIDPLAAAQTGYGNVWVRDNIYVALALEAAGQHHAAVTVALQLAEFYRRHRERFVAIIEGRTDPSLPANRPPVRFDGIKLAELPVSWPHAQNDALGYFVWLYCRLARAGQIAADEDLLTLFVQYFYAIRYWSDEDNGHWEERRKIEASSIGAVVAGLRALRALSSAGSAARPGQLDRLIAEGERALAGILPAECAQTDPRKYRRYDAALLFLAYPLEVVEDAMAQTIVGDVLEHLQGDFGIRRYLGDSYWTADYKQKMPASERTADVSERQEQRDALARVGEEAQWCIFDPVVSVIAGRRYLCTGDPADLDRQTHHFNRCLGQLTGPECPQGELRCPEAYYSEHGAYVPNDHVPLLWSQANLWLALLTMQQSVAHRSA
jgi:phosphorylase kinase alpha/beta subunit